MKRRTPKKGVIQKQLDNKTWVPVGRYELHECCDCGLVHKVDFRYNRRIKRFEERWTPLFTTKRKGHAHETRTRRRTPTRNQ